MQSGANNRPQATVRQKRAIRVYTINEVICTPYRHIKRVLMRVPHMPCQKLQLQNIMKVCDRSYTVSEIEFCIIGPETAKLHGS